MKKLVLSLKLVDSEGKALNIFCEEVGSTKKGAKDIEKMFDGMKDFNKDSIIEHPLKIYYTVKTQSLDTFNEVKISLLLLKKLKMLK